MIREIRPSGWQLYREVRLRALADAEAQPHEPDPGSVNLVRAT